MSSLLQRSYVVVMPQHLDIIHFVVKAFAARDVVVDERKKWQSIKFERTKLAELRAYLPGILIEWNEVEDRPHMKIGIASLQLGRALQVVQSKPVPAPAKIPAHDTHTPPASAQVRDVCWWPGNDEQAEFFEKFFGKAA